MCTKLVNYIFLKNIAMNAVRWIMYCFYSSREAQHNLRKKWTIDAEKRYNENDKCLLVLLDVFLQLWFKCGKL